MDEDYVVLKADMRNTFNIVYEKQSLMNMLQFSLGWVGTIGPIIYLLRHTPGRVHPESGRARR